MIRSRAAAVAIATAVSLSVAACSGNDDPTAPNTVDILSLADAADAFDALIKAGLFAIQPTGNPVALAAETIPIDETEPCPNGGTARTQGSIEFTEGSGEGLSADLRQTHDACRSTSSSGRVWTFDSDPGIRTQLQFRPVPGSDGGNWTGSITGNFDYESNGATGSCTTNLVFPGTPTGPGRPSGTTCGHDINLLRPPTSEP